jgi:ATPase family protein associated with various cellular activities (AAA)
MSQFLELANHRHLLQEFCRQHVPSLLIFQSEPSFKLNLIEPALDGELHHLTSTSTCIESLLDCPRQFRPKNFQSDFVLAREFAVRAINRKARDWKSEGSARIYCRCRALPFVVRHLPEYDKRIARHLESILKQLGEQDRFAIGEADPQIKREDWYPPNAFHTYWFLSILDELKKRFGPQLKVLNERLSLEVRRSEMLLWARSVAGRQISLHSADSSSLDSAHLAWSLAILSRFSNDLQSNLADQDFIREGFKSLFFKQTQVGTWRHGQPLFHYKYSGNAYCYVYETFTVLLKVALERQKGGEFLRSALRPFFQQLIDLWKYARTTQIPIGDDEKSIGWSSGHRIDHLYAESWATASVFSYAQALRRLVGTWTRDEALIGLNQVSTFPTVEAAHAQIIERGDTWPYKASPVSDVAQQLVTLFVNPTRKAEPEVAIEPDNPPIQGQQARSAILFGPPGTSKTNLARAVAGAIGWRYIELHASHFVAEGLPAVQRTADDIFQRLMELDHTVVLFDEIDELVRERDVEPDAFGRFLTTSMLPKLAELWNQRKVVYFIATNHIEYFDRAVTRAQRFDALIFVTPPSFDKKVKQLKELLAKMRSGATIEIAVTAEEVSQVLASLECTDQKRDDDTLPETQVLAKFIMLRWDQLDELAVCINSSAGESADALTVSKDLLCRALKEISDPSLQMRKAYRDYQKAERYLMKDYSKDAVWEVENLENMGNYEAPLEKVSGKVWLTCVEAPNKILAGPYRYAITAVGRVRASRGD